MTILYPRLSTQEGRFILQKYCLLTVEQLRVNAMSGDHRLRSYAATGGVPATADHLEFLAKEVRTCAEMNGYPDAANGIQRVHFDRSTAALLHETMDIAPAEAAEPDVWTYMAVTLLPDVVHWRFGSDNTERWLGRGIVRHAFARLWWQAHALRTTAEGVSDYTLLNSLSESDLNQIFERRSIGGMPPLARAIARCLLDPRIDEIEVPRREVVRDVTKRIRRILQFTSVLALSSEQLDARITGILEASLAELSRLADGR